MMFSKISPLSIVETKLAAMPGSGGTAGSGTVDGGVALYDWEDHPSLLRDSLWRMARGARLCDVKIGFCSGVATNSIFFCFLSVKTH